MKVSAIVLATAALLAACNAAPNSAGQVSERIGLIVNDPSSRELDLSSLTTFGWDRLHLFKAGTTREDVCKFLGAGRNVCGRVVRFETVPADHVATVFTLGSQLTHLELHADANGVFDVESGETGLPKSSCVFRVRHGAGPTAVSHLETK